MAQVSPRRRGRKHVPEATYGVLVRALRQAGLNDQVYRLQLFMLWEKAVGPRIAARTQPQSFSRGTLVIRAATSTWQQELMFLRGAIIAKLNALLDRPRVHALKVISGHLPSEQVQPTAPPRQPTLVERASAADCSATIVDDGVRQAFADLMALHLRNQADTP